MKKLSTSLLLLLALLTGCGGGGDGTSDPSPSVANVQLTTSTQVAPVTVATPAVVNPFQTPQFETPTAIPIDKFRLAQLDYRYDTSKNQWFPKVKSIIFGGIEKIVREDKEIELEIE